MVPLRGDVVMLTLMYFPLRPMTKASSTSQSTSLAEQMKHVQHEEAPKDISIYTLILHRILEWAFAKNALFFNVLLIHTTQCTKGNGGADYTCKNVLTYSRCWEGVQSSEEIWTWKTKKVRIWLCFDYSLLEKKRHLHNLQVDISHNVPYKLNPL